MVVNLDRSNIGNKLATTTVLRNSLGQQEVIYYSTIMSFHQIRSRERAKYKTVIHCSVPVYNRANADKDFALAFCVVKVIRTRHILMDR